MKYTIVLDPLPCLLEFGPSFEDYKFCPDCLPPTRATAISKIINSFRSFQSAERNKYNRLEAVR